MALGGAANTLVTSRPLRCPLGTTRYCVHVVATVAAATWQVWDDKSLLNVDFSTICPAYSVKDINNLEKQFLEMIQYNVSISASLYASYYFELRTLCEKAERSFTLKPLSEQAVRRPPQRDDL